MVIGRLSVPAPIAISGAQGVRRDRLAGSG
jgi:hypothetical protein